MYEKNTIKTYLILINLHNWLQICPRNYIAFFLIGGHRETPHLVYFLGFP